jgi:hypothetical protein
MKEPANQDTRPSSFWRWIAPVTSLFVIILLGIICSRGQRISRASFGEEDTGSALGDAEAEIELGPTEPEGNGT